MSFKAGFLTNTRSVFNLKPVFGFPMEPKAVRQSESEDSVVNWSESVKFSFSLSVMPAGTHTFGLKDTKIPFHSSMVSK